MNEEQIKAMIDDSMATVGEQMTKVAADAATKAVSDAQKDWSARVEALEASAQAKAAEAVTDDAKGDAAKDTAVTMDQVAEAVQKALTDQATKSEADATVKAAVGTYAADKMKDLPQTYQAMLPATGDGEKLKTAEQEIRAKFQTDMKAVGVTLPDVGESTDAAAGAAAAAPDVSKMSATQKIAAGLNAGA